MTQSNDQNSPGPTPAPGPTSILKRGMTPTHELMGEWILQNPGGTLREMGAYFGYSESWLSQVINSDMFKTYMSERMGDIQGYVSMDIPQKMKHLADLSIERMREVLEKTSDGELIKDSFDKVMHRYGYAPNARNAIQPAGPAALQQNNVFFLNREDFNRVQERLVSSHSNPATPQELPAPAAPALEEDGKQPIPTDT